MDRQAKIMARRHKAQEWQDRRRSAGLGVAVIARAVGVSNQTVYNWESGATSPTPRLRRAYEAALDEWCATGTRFATAYEAYAEQEAARRGITVRAYHVRHRQERDRTAHELGVLVGARSHTVLGWESGAIRPNAASYARWMEALAMLPERNRYDDDGNFLGHGEIRDWSEFLDKK